MTWYLDDTLIHHRPLPPLPPPHPPPSVKCWFFSGAESTRVLSVSFNKLISISLQKLWRSFKSLQKHTCRPPSSGTGSPFRKAIDLYIPGTPGTPFRKALDLYIPGTPGSPENLDISLVPLDLPSENLDISLVPLDLPSENLDISLLPLQHCHWAKIIDRHF